jgi:hypothetical protein
MGTPSSESTSTRIRTTHGGRRPGAGRPSSQIDRVLAEIQKFPRPDLGTDVYAISNMSLALIMKWPVQRVAMANRAGRIVYLAPAGRVSVSQRARRRGDTRYERGYRKIGIYAIHPNEFARPLEFGTGPEERLTPIVPEGATVPIVPTVTMVGKRSSSGPAPNSSSETPRWLWEMGVKRRFELRVAAALDAAHRARKETPPSYRFWRYHVSNVGAFSLTRKMLRRFVEGLAELGWLRPEAVRARDGGRPTVRFRINPRLLAGRHDRSRHIRPEACRGS